MTKADFRVMVVSTGQRGRLCSLDYRTPIVKLDSNGAQVRVPWANLVSFINEPPVLSVRPVELSQCEVIEIEEICTGGVAGV